MAFGSWTLRAAQSAQIPHVCADGALAALARSLLSP
jgi:hypothetical protein